MKALVHIENGQLIQLVADSETFETHSDYAWKDFDETGNLIDLIVNFF